VSAAWAVALADDVGWLWAPVAFVVGSVALGYGVWRAPRVAAERAAPAAEESLTVQRDGLVHEVGTLRIEAPWGAVRGIDDHPEGVHVALSGGRFLFVPRRVVPAGFTGQLESLRKGGRPTLVPQEVPEGFDTCVLRFRATMEDYIAFARRLDRRRSVAAAPYAAGALLVGALLADRGVDALTLVAVAVWTALLALSSSLRRALRRWVVPAQVRRQVQADPDRLPRGAVSVGLGPAGGWLRAPEGESRFGWEEVAHVDVDDDALVLLFGQELGTVLPVRAFGSPEEMARVCVAIEGWRRAAGRGERQVPRGKADASTPWAPPAG
jgi:hypothetical protein